MRPFRFRCFTAAVLCVVASVGHGQSTDEEQELALSYGDKSIVTIATGTRQPLSRAPAVATVITAEDIRAIGATDLDQVLETVPGVHVAVSSIGYNPIYVIRGIYTNVNAQVLLLINGIPINNVFAGDRSQVWGGMPVQDISRIEVIRGPGSALYGADAFAGVINIITKTASDINGTEFGLRGGSFDTQQGWILHGGHLGPFDAAFSLEIGTTEGQRRTVAADAQTGLDALFGTHASLAPEPVNTQRDNIDARFDLAYGSWRFRAGYQGRRNIGTGVGTAQALDPVGHGDSDRINADLTYSDPNFSQDWDVSAQLGYFDVSTRADLVLFPPGAIGGAFPDGVIGNPDVYERHARLGLNAFYTGIAKHKIRLGTGYNFDDLYKVRETKNFFQNPAGIPIPLGSVVDVSATAPFVRPTDRNVLYAFAQDEWSFKPDWALTAGLRYDHYSDVGQTVNPRLALVWDTAYDLTTKLLYGRAFRAPSFQELYNINNPVALGNPDLKPETIETLELAFAYQPTSKVSTGLNLFRYEIRDFLRFTQDSTSATSFTAHNAGTQKGYGLELEAAWEVASNLRLSGNYAFQRSTDDTTGQDAGNAPHHQIYARVDWRFLPHWTWNTQAKWITERKRVAGDPRPDLPGYTTVDMTLRREKLGNSKWDMAMSVRNLFDADAREPSPSPGLIPNDLPLAGRSFYVELRRGL